MGFKPGMAWATASIRFRANNGRISLKLTAKKGATVVGSDSTSALFELLLPQYVDHTIRLNVGVPADCGHYADGLANGSVWMSFPVPPTGAVHTWGRYPAQDSKTDAQPMCSTGGSGSGGSDWINDLVGDEYSMSSEEEPYPPDGEEYEGQCEICQRWYLYYYDEIIATWWECSEIDNSYCYSLTEAR
jgi:hypothetical protein